MKCSYCNSDMEIGVIQSSQEIFWSKKINNFYFRSNSKKGDVCLAPMSWLGCAKEANLCRNCKKVIISFNEE